MRIILLTTLTILLSACTKPTTITTTTAIEAYKLCKAHKSQISITKDNRYVPLTYLRDNPSIEVEVSTRKGVLEVKLK